MAVMRFSPLLVAVAGFLAAAVALPAAPEVWSGLDVSFSKAPNTDPTLEANQDRITDEVWLTRDPFQGGLFNATLESLWDFATFDSPKGTEWAVAGLNGNPATISSSDHASLNFDTFTNAYGGTGVLAYNIVGARAVVHLVEDDIYLELEVTGWGQGNMGGGGSFSYLRSGPPAAPPPAIAISKGSGGELVIEFTGTLQACDDLASWLDLVPQPSSPYTVVPGAAVPRFYRARD